LKGAILIAKELNSNPNITSLELFGNKIGDDSQKIFSQMISLNTSLKRLKLGDNLIGKKYK
jgi:Ran GTPase-activating protein (RanGAP) involved in mRNA processing and transport